MKRKDEYSFRFWAGWLENLQIKLTQALKSISLSHFTLWNFVKLHTSRSSIV